MKPIYEIDAAIMALVDQETGEILDYEAFEALNMERDQKLESMALWYKDLVAEAKAIREEEIALQKRRQQNERSADRLKKYLEELLAGSKFKTPRVSCWFSSTQSVQIEDEAAFIEAMEATGNKEFIKYSAPEVNKTAIKDAIKRGVEIEGAAIVQNPYIIIK